MSEQKNQQNQQGIPEAIIPLDILARILDYINSNKIDLAKDTLTTLIESLTYGGVTVAPLPTQQGQQARKVEE